MHFHMFITAIICLVDTAQGASNLGKNSLLTCSLVPRSWPIDIINRLWSVTLTAAGDPMKCSCFPPVNRRWGTHYAR
ncbi:hypothetical protein TWF173_003163 [Orbilia oligospora]|nr:hypothetical protein TWF173_003163 [Orbilia oligospora]